MTTPLWESTLFGGWAIMRTPRPIASGALRRLAIASVFSSTSEVTSATCWLPVIGESGLPTAAPQQLWPRLGEDVPRFDWEHTILSAPRTIIRVISAGQGRVRVLAVKGLEAHVEQGPFESSTRLTTWKPVWGSVWASLMEQALKRFSLSEQRSPTETDPWLSTRLPFSFRIRIRTLLWRDPVMFPSDRETDSPFRIWTVLRRRLIDAHLQGGMSLDSSSPLGRRFALMLGLERLFLRKRDPATKVFLSDKEGIEPSGSRAQSAKKDQNTIHQASLWESE